MGSNKPVAHFCILGIYQMNDGFTNTNRIGIIEDPFDKL